MIRKEDLKSAKYIYKTGIINDFPAAERIPYSRFKRAVKNKIMKVYRYIIDGKRIGYFVIIEEDGVIFISYLAINKEYRNLGYGSKMLKEFYEYFKTKKYIVIEADSPEGITDKDDLNTIRRRKEFYFKNGFEELKNIDYCIYGVRYDILVYKLSSQTVTNKDAIDIIKKMYSKITYNMRFFHMEAM